MNPSNSEPEGVRTTARVTSHTPGRLRVRIEGTHPHRHLLHEAQHRLEQHPCMKRVEANSTTGSLLLHYDPGQLSKDHLLGVLEDVGIIVRDVEAARGNELPEVGKSSTATNITDALDDLDRRLSLLTGRRVDLKLLFPMTMGALGLRQTLSSGLGLNQVPAWMLLWYAFDSFWMLHHKTHPGEPSSASPQS